MPKVELHLHLDCCLSYEAAAKLSPGLTLGQYERDFTGPDRVNGLTDFLSRTLNHVALLQQPCLAAVDDFVVGVKHKGVIQLGDVSLSLPLLGALAPPGAARAAA